MTHQVSRFIHSITVGEKMKTSWNNKTFKEPPFLLLLLKNLKFLSLQYPLTIQSFLCLLLTRIFVLASFLQLCFSWKYEQWMCSGNAFSFETITRILKFQLCLIFSFLHNTVIEERENTKTYQSVNHGEAITATELFE